eukprot:IDg13475t1
MESWSPCRLLTLLVALSIAAVPTCAFSISENPQRLLVVVDDESIANTHAGLLESLRSKNFDLDIRSASKGDLPLMADGEYAYAGVALLCPTARGIEKKLPLATLEAFIDAGHDVFLAASTGFSEYTRGAARLM